MGVTMTDKKSNDSRRKLLKSIAAGSGAIIAGKSLPESWARPVVDSVILPTHAQTTDDTGSSPTVTAIYEYDYKSQFEERRGCVQIMSDGTAMVEYTDGDGCGSYAQYKFAGTIPSDGTKGTVSRVDKGKNCGEDGANFLVVREASLGNIGEGSLILMVEVGDPVHGRPSNRDTGVKSTRYVRADNCPVVAVEDCEECPSDIRLKTNIETLPASREGYDLYKFQYIDDKNENTYVGVMAQDILSRNPEAVVQNESGFYKVRYAQLGLKMVTLEQWESEGSDSVELLH